MPTFVLFCVDKPGSVDLRMATREAHLAYMRDKAAMMKLGGPMINENGDMAGSLLIVEAPDRAAAVELNAHDPYTLAGLWERVDVKAFKATLGQL
jgi:uncharacterized protein YciI